MNMKSLSKISTKKSLKEDNRENERIIKCSIILFDILFAFSTEENVIANWEIVNECNVSIEREQKIILAKKFLFCWERWNSKLSFKNCSSSMIYFCFSIFLWYSVLSYLLRFIISFSYMSNTLLCWTKKKKRTPFVRSEDSKKKWSWFQLFNHFSW